MKCQHDCQEMFDIDEIKLLNSNIRVHIPSPLNQLDGLQNLNVFAHTLSNVDFLSNFSFCITF